MSAAQSAMDSDSGEAQRRSQSSTLSRASHDPLLSACWGIGVWVHWTGIDSDGEGESSAGGGGEGGRAGVAKARKFSWASSCKQRLIAGRGA